jgi:hypothetical protein
MFLLDGLNTRTNTSASFFATLCLYARLLVVRPMRLLTNARAVPLLYRLLARDTPHNTISTKPLTCLQPAHFCHCPTRSSFFLHSEYEHSRSTRSFIVPWRILHPQVLRHPEISRASSGPFIVRDGCLSPSTTLYQHQASNNRYVLCIRTALLELPNDLD